ncbi:hypothetical protein ABMA70_13235 [Halobacteriovorax sp. XZX-3]|uniref:hypothetical protein n=1 Tax=unclassified Halobacteriovorax TaxID=2639665 RepID=UPI00371439F0
MFIRLFRYLLLATFFATSSIASDISLNDLIESRGKDLASGQIIELMNGEKVEFIKILGAGNTTTIHEVKSGNNIYALRVPKYHGAFNTFSKYSNYIDAFYLGHASLESQGVSIPEIYAYEKENYLLVEKLNLKDSFDLDAFFLNKEAINPEDFAKALDKLPDFFESIAAYTLVKDFHLGQLVYSPHDERWILMDWTHSHELFKDGQDKLPFTVDSVKVQAEKYEKTFKLTEEFKDLFKRIESRMQNKRNTILDNDKLFLESLSSLSTEEFMSAIQNPPKGYSNNLTLGIIDRLSLMNVPNELPEYLIANHGDFKYLLERFLERTDSIDDLVTLLNLKDNLGMKIDWNLEMKIQKIITNSDSNTPINLYRKLLDHNFVTSYAKAWIKRERLDIETSNNCVDVLRQLVSNPL